MQSLEQKLGFDSVREMVRGKCATSGARRIIDASGMMTSREAIAEALQYRNLDRLGAK